jgi:hypothetical protein
MHACMPAMECCPWSVAALPPEYERMHACRCRPTPGSHGSTELFYGRVTAIAIGVLVTLVFDLIFPWYFSPLSQGYFCYMFSKSSRLHAVC